MDDPTLVLRDIHQVAAPPWWPPAPGWWVVAGVLAAAIAAIAWWRLRKRRAQRRIARLFDEAVSPALEPAAQVAAVSELLRRAARRRLPDADKLAGEEWLAFLDAGDARAPFSAGEGRVLLDGAFRRDVDPGSVAAMRELARARFLQWMAG